jgi:hypothetical protein
MVILCGHLMDHRHRTCGTYDAYRGRPAVVQGSVAGEVLERSQPALSGSPEEQ